MRSERRQKTNEYAQIFPGYIRRLFKSIRKNHKLADCRVEFHIFYILGYFLDGFVKKNDDFAGRAFFLRLLDATGFIIFFDGANRETNLQTFSRKRLTPTSPFSSQMIACSNGPINITKTLKVSAPNLIMISSA